MVLLIYIQSRVYSFLSRTINSCFTYFCVKSPASAQKFLFCVFFTAACDTKTISAPPSKI